MIVNMVAPWGTKYHYMSGIHTNVTTVQLPSGQAWYSYLWDKPQNWGNDLVNCVSLPSAGGKAASGQWGQCIMKKRPLLQKVAVVMGAASAPLRCAGALLCYGGAWE